MAIFRGTEAQPETDEDDQIFGTDEADSIKLFSGNDAAYGNGGNDIIWGGSGHDLLHGDAGNDRIYGQTGDDFLIGGTGHNYLSGGFGDDLVVGDTDSTNTLLGGAGNDTLSSTGNGDIANGGSGDDFIFLISGRELGGSGNDSLATGSNELHPGPVAMTGGQGADSFSDYMAHDDAAENVTITDFSQADGDKISMGFLVVQPTGAAYASTADVFNALDTNHDGQLTGWQADGTGDQFTSYDPSANTLTQHVWEDTLTTPGAHVDWSMLG